MGPAQFAPDADRAFVEFFGRDAGLRTFLSGLQKRLKSVGKMFATVGTGLAVGGIARLLPMIGVVNKLGEMSKMNDVAKAFGLAGEKASGFFGMLGAMGGDFKENQEGLIQFSQKVKDAAKGVGGATGEAAALFDGLSVSAKEMIDLPLDEQFYRVLGAIRELPQEQQKFKLAMLGGSDSQKQWIRLLNKSEAELRAMAKGLAVTQEELDKAAAAQLAYEEATRALGLVWQNVAIALAGVVEVVSKWATSVLGPLAETVKQNKALIVAFVAASAATVALGVAFIGAGAAISGALAVLGAVSLVVSALATPVGLAVAAVAALGAGFLYLAGVGSTLKTTLAGISDALASGDMGLAWSIGLAGMKVEWLQLVETLTLVWNDFKSFFVDGWHDAAYLFGQTWGDVVAAFSRGVGVMLRVGADLVEGFAGIWEGIAAGASGMFVVTERAMRDSVDRMLKIAEAVMGGTGSIAAAQLVGRARRQIADMPTGQGIIGGVLDSARESAAGLASELRDSADLLGRADSGGTNLEAHKQFQRDQAAREAARKADAEAARGGVAAAEKERRDLMVTAAFRRMFGGGGAGTGAGAGGIGQEVAGAMNAIRGGFAGFGSLQSMFGGGGPNREVVKRLDKLVEKTDEEKDVLEEIARALGDSPRGDFVWGV